MISITWAQHEIYERTSSVPLTYHYSTTMLQNVEKTKGKPVPFEYHYSTSIFWVDPYAILSKIHANLLYFLSATYDKINNTFIKLL